jgi:4-alpha-glucanotransferase
MAPDTYQQLLARAASACGIDPEYWDIWGRHHIIGPEAMRSILTAMGVGCASVEELKASLAECARREWTRPAPPALVVSENKPREIPLQASAETLAEPARVELRLEDGAAHVFEFDLRALRQSASAEMDGGAWMRRMALLPVEVPAGYHDVTVTHAGRTAQMRYIVTPDRAWTHPHLARGGKAAGIAFSLYGLRSARNWGCGDFRDLHELVDWVASEADASFVGLNPLHAIHNRRPFNTSPYLPNCSFYQNFIYLDVEAIDDFATCPRARRAWERPETQAEVAALRASEFVEYERVAALKLRFLKLAFIHFLRDYRAGHQRTAAFRDFAAREGALLERFATYCALDEHLHHRNPDMWLWTQWPEPYRDPDSEATHAFRRKHWRTVLFYQWLQWHIDRQLAEAQRKASERLALGLYHDLALATDRFGSDLWANRPFYVNGCRVGSPPDDFAPQGQDWGFPPPRSDYHRETGYRLFVDSIRKNCRHGGALRIDHVMRLFRLFWIPDDSDAAHGAYVRERYEDVVRILALESVRNRVVVVGEDLGTVEPHVRETLQRFGILSYRLFYFEKRDDGAFKHYSEYPAQALVSSTTHDLPTIAGFWTGEDLTARRRAGVLDEAAFVSQTRARAGEKQKILDLLHALGLLPAYVPRSATDLPELTGDLHNAIVGYLALTPSQLLCINQEDLTKEIAQQNLPSTTWQYPNWGRKMRYTLEELRTAIDARNFAAMLRHWLSRTGRRNSAIV